MTLYVKGKPKAQPRPRRSKSGGVYTPPSADEWKAAVVDAAVRAGLTNRRKGPVAVKIRFELPRPKRLALATDPVPHVAKPDVDNLEKAVLDALTTAGAWLDDSQVYDIRSTKLYAERDANPGAWIFLTFE